jgi:proline iminopeptidase
MTYVTTADGRLFVDVRGDRTAPPVLYLHGGPGMSCHTFMLWQGPLLSRTCLLVGFDQRGVLRSDALTGDVLTDEALVADCEAVRAALGIERWTVLGLSFGGRIALQYATRHPDRVAVVVFENPCWDFAETERVRLAAAAPVFAELGDHDAAERCRHLAEHPDARTTWRDTIELVGRLQDHGRYDDLYFHQPSARTAFQAIDMAAEFGDEAMAKSGHHSEAALDLMATPVTGVLPSLTVPAVLVVGRHDLVTGPGQIAAFRSAVPHGEVREFAESAHFVQLEQAEEYADLVSRVAAARG